MATLGIRYVYEKREIIINEVDWQECKEGCKSVFEMEDLSRKWKLAAYIRNKNILCFPIKDRN